MKNKQDHEAHLFLDTLMAPMTWVHENVLKHLCFSKRTSHMTIGIVVMILGSTIAALAPHSPFVLHIAVDVLGYYLHGMGAAPLVKVALEFFGVEGA